MSEIDLATPADEESWGVVLDRPYYPWIETFATEEEARERARRAIAEEHDDPGKHQSRVYVVRVAAVADIRTHY